MRLALYITTLITALTFIQANIIIKQINSLYDTEPTVFVPLKKETKVKNQILGTSVKIANAIKYVESKGNYNARGLSGEYGAYQMMPTTYNILSKKCLGKVVEPTPANQDMIVICTFKTLLEENRKPKEIIQWWNSGSFTRCPKGVNKYGAKYDCPAYVAKVVAHIK